MLHIELHITEHSSHYVLISTIIDNYHSYPPSCRKTYVNHVNHWNCPFDGSAATRGRSWSATPSASVVLILGLGTTFLSHLGVCHHSIDTTSPPKLIFLRALLHKAPFYPLIGPLRRTLSLLLLFGNVTESVLSRYVSKQLWESLHILCNGDTLCIVTLSSTSSLVDNTTNAYVVTVETDGDSLTKRGSQTDNTRMRLHR